MTGRKYSFRSAVQRAQAENLPAVGGENHGAHPGRVSHQPGQAPAGGNFPQRDHAIGPAGEQAPPIRREAQGARLVEGPVNGGASEGDVALFVVSADGDLRVASPGKSPLVKAGDRVIALVGAR